jgi:hypothetical protein
MSFDKNPTKSELETAIKAMIAKNLNKSYEEKVELVSLDSTDTKNQKLKNQKQ